MIDYQKITEELEIEKVIELMKQLGADRYKDAGNAIIFPTICHNENSDEASMKLYFYKDTHLFHCYTDCSESFTIFKFLKKYYDCRGIEYDWYNDIFQVVLSCSASKAREVAGVQTYTSHRADYERTKTRKELPTYPDGILDVFVKGVYPVEWLNDRITKQAMDKFDIRYSISQNKIIIPHWDAEHRLVGIRGRALNPQEVEAVGKYMPVQIEGKWYSHPLSLNLYGLAQNKQNIKSNGIAYIFEGEKSVLQADSYSIPNCAVACCGSNINKFQIALLLKYCAPREICICLDNEEEHGSDKYFNKLYNMAKKYSNYCKMSFIYDRKGLTEHKDSPTDKGEEIFEKLLKERVFV